ncbi:MAG: FHA domain-containing protein [Paucibacter sp.]|nr:FHA domain-containing protein [Roseateles sp.]
MKGVIEILDREGQVRAAFKLGGAEQGRVRIGRSPDCELVLDDVHLAGEHAEIRATESSAELVLFPSINGGWLGEHRMSAGESAALGGQALFQLGATHLRWRAADAPLPPEVPLADHQKRQAHRSLWWLPVLMAAWACLQVFDFWLGAVPDTKLIAYAWPLLTPVIAALAWAGVWALVTQLFQHRFPFAKHLRRVLIWALAVSSLDYLLPGVAYSFGWPRFAALSDVLMPALFAFLIWWHASLVWPRVRRSIGVGLGVLLMVALGLRVGQRSEEQYLFGARYLSALPPPTLRLVRPKPPEVLLDDLRELRQPLDKMARKDSNAPAGSEEEE